MAIRTKGFMGYSFQRKYFPNINNSTTTAICMRQPMSNHFSAFARCRRAASRSPRSRAERADWRSSIEKKSPASRNDQPRLIPLFANAVFAAPTPVQAVCTVPRPILPRQHPRQLLPHRNTGTQSVLRHCRTPLSRTSRISFHRPSLCVLCVLCGLSFHARKVITRLTIISFSCGFDSAILLNVEMWKCCQSQCCQFQFQPPIFFFAVITLAERMRDRKTWGQTPRLRKQSA